MSPSLFVAKDQSRLVIESFGVKNHRLQSNQFVGRRDEEEEEEEEKEDGENRG